MSDRPYKRARGSRSTSTRYFDFDLSSSSTHPSPRRPAPVPTQARFFILPNNQIHDTRCRSSFTASSSSTPKEPKNPPDPSSSALQSCDSTSSDSDSQADANGEGMAAERTLEDKEKDQKMEEQTGDQSMEDGTLEESLEKIELGMQDESDQSISNNIGGESGESAANPPKKKCGPEEIAAKREIALQRLEVTKERLARKREEEDQRALGASKLAEFGYRPADSTPKKPIIVSDAINEENLTFVPKSICSDEQIEILELVEKGSNVFITGSAGVGKSLLLSEITRLLTLKNVEFSVTAPTGVAAINVGGNTLHSWAGVGDGKESISELYDKIVAWKTRRDSWQHTQVLIIDEVSMVHPSLFFRLNVLGKLLRESSRPFGGIQLVVCGDFFQLPPVDNDVVIEMPCIRCGMQLLEEIDTQVRQRRDGSEEPIKLRCSRRMVNGKEETPCGMEFSIPTYAFQSEAWMECNFEVRELTKVFRQSDLKFIEVLEKIRRGNPDQACLEFFKSCGSSLRSGTVKIKPTLLFPTREKAGFDELQGPTHRFVARDEAQGAYAERVMNVRLQDFPSPKSFRARVGAQVILLANLDAKRGLINGTRGVIVGYGSPPSAATIRAELSSKRYKSDEEKERLRTEIGTAEWKVDALIEHLEQQNHKLLPRVYFATRRKDANGKETVEEFTQLIIPQHKVVRLGRFGTIARTQLPLELAWAMTVHKSQGQSLDAAQIDVKQSFAPGQVYVALSRCRTPEGMCVRDFSLSCIKTSPAVKEFYKSIEKKSPFVSSPTSIRNPLDFLTLSLRCALSKLEPTFRDPNRRNSPASHVRPAASVPVSVATSSSVSHGSGDYRNQLLAAARNYIDRQRNLGSTGGFVVVDENGFVEAAKHAIMLAQEGAQPVDQTREGGGESVRKRSNSQPLSPREAANTTHTSPSKRMRSTPLHLGQGAKGAALEEVEQKMCLVSGSEGQAEKEETAAEIEMEKKKKRDKRRRHKQNLKERKKQEKLAELA